MKDKGSVLRFLWIVAKVVQGLLIHPYQTMQNVVREKRLIWLSFVPSLTWAGWVSLLFLGCFLLKTFTPCCSPFEVSAQLLTWLSVWLGGFFEFVIWWSHFFCLYWQLLLFYLLLRFWFGFRGQE